MSRMDPALVRIPAPRSLALAVLVTAVAGCAGHTRYAVTEESEPFSASNARLRMMASGEVEAVSFDRLLRARDEPANWLTYYGAYDGQRFSTLDQIHARNVQDLRPAWTFQHGIIGIVATPATYAFEAAPIVVDGVMYVTGPDGWAWALDAASGDMRWEYQHAVPLDVPLCCGNVNRGAAVAEGKVFFATPNGHLVALDAATGEEVWDVPFADIRAGESATVAPLVVKNLVIVGSSGAEYGTRGHIDAFDIETGARVWRRYTVPKPGEPGSESWPEEGDAWARGGGTAWVTGTYDPELDLVFWGTGNPSPVFDRGVREGANLYTNSVLALDPADGSIRWHYQWTPGDVWDYDGVNENILIDRDGRKLLAHFDKNGYLFVLDRETGELVRATRFARATWGEIDPSTGAIRVELVPTEEGVEICPGPAGAKEWPHAAYSPNTGLLYAPVVEQCATFKTGESEFAESMPYWGSAAQPLRPENWGHIKAFDPTTGREAWSYRTEHPVVASVLATAGDLVFTGLPTGEFLALDAQTGEPLWHYQTGSGIHGNPVTYSVDGKQYVAVPSGWGGWVKGFAPELYGAPRGIALHVFALP